MPDVVVVGGGVVGLSIAWFAARDGARVALVDEAPGRGASWAAAGMLAPVTEVHYGEDDLLRLNIASAAAWPRFAADLWDATGTDPGYHQCGTLMVARDADDNAALDDVFAHQRRLGLEATRLRSRSCRAIEPGLAPGVRGGILVAGDHQVDNRALVSGLLDACARSGVELVRATVHALVGSNGAAGVRLDSGDTIEGGRVVVAAGWRSGGIPGAPPELAVVRPVKGQLLHLRARDGAAWTSHNVRGLEVYVVSRPDGRVVVGATVEEKGPDAGVTAAGVHQLLDEARRLLPDVGELDFVEATAGLRPGTPDNAPLLGETSVEDVFAATGHYRNGVLLAPITAAAVVDLINDRGAAEIDAFSPLRFASAKALSR